MQPGALGLAFEIASCQHDGQRDKAGEPYMAHVIRVFCGVRRSDHQIVALLHDVVEDGHLRLDHIEDHFEPDIVAAVDAITKRKGEPYREYLDRVKGNPAALAVKLADIADNSSEDRLAKLMPDVAERLRGKYEMALKILREQ